MLGFAYAATATAPVAVAARVKTRRLILRVVRALGVRSTTAFASLAAVDRRPVTLPVRGRRDSRSPGQV